MKTTIHSVTALLLAGGVSLVFGASPAPAQTPVSLSLVKYVAPEFPGAARLEGVAEGTAVVMFSHDATGRVSDAVAIESTHPAFAREAVEAVQQWRVAPHGENGSVCQCAHLIPFSFRAEFVTRINATASSAIRRESSRRTASSAALLMTFDDLEARPRLLNSALPSLPAGVRSALKSGLVRVTFLVDEQGRIRVPSIVSAADPALGAAVLAALAQWRYEAPQKNGRTVVAMTDLHFDFGNTTASNVVASLVVPAGRNQR